MNNEQVNQRILEKLRRANHYEPAKPSPEREAFLRESMAHTRNIFQKEKKQGKKEKEVTC